LSNQLSSLFFVYGVLLKTEYLRSHILLVSKEDLEGIKEDYKEYF